ncbi:MAG: glycosyltransferase [Acidobacteriota bacterium]|nr:glycosyltransferase [Acidobacteriota bacterium]
MTILSVAYPLFPVAQDSGGGAEQIVYLLDREFTRLGHCSIVVAGSVNAIQRILRERPVDLIHFHGLDFHEYVPETSVLMLATLHLPLSWYPESIFSLLPRVKLNCVSASQAAGTGLPVVLNGIDTARFQVAAAKEDYLLWLGRICPEKGTHLALRVARRLGMKMIVAGPVHDFEFHRQYFANEVAPLLDSERKYIGPVQGEDKTKLLAEARCVVVSSLVAETSSLVAMEAIASGTAVVAFRSGALPKVVEEGVTGFIVDSEEEMAEAVVKVHRISPGICRSRAVTRFDAGRMARDYLSLYAGAG